MKGAKNKAIEKRGGSEYIKHLPTTRKGGNSPRDIYEREAAELKRDKYKGSISWKHLQNKTKGVEHADDVRSARARLAALKIKHKQAYVEQATHKKGDWMVHYK